MSYNHILSIKDLTVTYNNYGNTVKALDNLNIEPILQGNWVFLYGSNGSGKSTLLKVITNCIDEYTGTIVLNGTNLKSINSKKLSDIVFLINQNPLASTVDELTVWENLLFATDSKTKNELEESLKLSGLLQHKNQLAKNLSGGERQLLALQIVKLRNVQLLLLDEPFAALDPENANKAFEMVTKIWKSGTTIIFVSHDNSLIEKSEFNNCIKLKFNEGKLI